MKTLEEKIIQKVYYLETRQTLSQLFYRLTLMTGLTIAGIFLIIFTIRELTQLQTLDLLEIFFEDLGVIKENIWEVFGIILQEIPAAEILFAIISLVLSVILLSKFVYNFGKLKNRISSLIKFWFHRVWLGSTASDAVLKL